jgi:alpha-L-fucosidase 2
LALGCLGLCVLLCAGCQEESPDKNTQVQEPDPPPDRSKFHVYLCFGQSNMEGYNGAYVKDETGNPIQMQDREYTNSRFQVLAAVDMPNLDRTAGKWYTASPPLCRGDSGISPADYFGRAMVENLPEDITVGVINVSVAGSAIELFDKDKYAAYLPTTADWLQSIAAQYGNNPYQRLVDLANIARKKGVIKGILLHQGESNSGQQDWPQKVKAIYDNLVNDIGLDENIPLLAGQVAGGGTSGMNGIILKLPNTISSARVIRTDGLPSHVDNLHFTPEGYRELGRRYAAEMLDILGYPVKE